MSAEQGHRAGTAGLFRIGPYRRGGIECWCWDDVEVDLAWLGRGFGFGGFVRGNMVEVGFLFGGEDYVRAARLGRRLGCRSLVAFRLRAL